MLWSKHLLLRHPSFISGAFILNWWKFLLFTIILIDKQLIPVCFAILWGARCVCRASSCEQISYSIKSIFSSVVTVLGQPEPSFLFMVPLSLKLFKSFFNRSVSPIFHWMVSPNFIHRPPFFFIIILNDFVFFWKYYCELHMVMKRHCKQRGNSLKIYGNVI